MALRLLPFAFRSNCPFKLTQRLSSHFTFVPDTVPASEGNSLFLEIYCILELKKRFGSHTLLNTHTGETQRLNLFQAINNAVDIALTSDPTAGKD